MLSLYALGAIGHDSSRPTLEYYRTSLEKKPEGRAAAAALQGFGVASLFDLIGTEKKASCFVVTAVSGSPTSLEVEVCRAFRDDVLQNFGAGRAFIERYYRVGPKLATFIASTPWLRRVTRLLLVQPAVALLIRLGFPRAAPCGLDRRLIGDLLNATWASGNRFSTAIVRSEVASKGV